MKKRISVLFGALLLVSSVAGAQEIRIRVGIPGVRVRPAPGPVVRGGDLSGRCADYDHSQFTQARDFAYSSTGLNLGNSEATDWALRYNRTHQCGSIGEFAARFAALREYAYSSVFLNMGSSEANAYAVARAEYISVGEAQRRKRLFTELKEFFYSSVYLNGGSSQSIASADEWLERGTCGERATIVSMKQVYQQEYRFAYSSSGMNLSSSDAKAYAIRKLRRLTPCTDLMR